MDEMQQQFNNEAALVMARTGYSQQGGNEINSLLEKLTNPAEEINEVQLALRGQRINEKGETEQVTDPLMNEKGIMRCIEVMKSMVNKVMFMSNLEDDQIRILTIVMGEHLVKILVFHKDEYAIKDHTNMTIIRTIITDRAFEAGMSALENGFRRFLKSGIIETTINTQGQPMKSGKGGGILSGIFGGKK